MSDCTCGYHAPEQHGPNGCAMLGCGCKWDGVLRAGSVAAARDALRKLTCPCDGDPLGNCAYVTVKTFVKSVAQERADRAAYIEKLEARIPVLVGLIDALHFALGKRKPHETPEMTAACVLDWIHDAKNPVEPIL